MSLPRSSEMDLPEPSFRRSVTYLDNRSYFQTTPTASSKTAWDSASGKVAVSWTADRYEEGEPCVAIVTALDDGLSGIGLKTGDSTTVGMRCHVTFVPQGFITASKGTQLVRIDVITERAMKYADIKDKYPDTLLNHNSQVMFTSIRPDGTGRLDTFFADVLTREDESGISKCFVPLSINPQTGESAEGYASIADQWIPVVRESTETNCGRPVANASVHDKTMEGVVPLSGREGSQGPERRVENRKKDWHEYHEHGQGGRSSAEIHLAHGWLQS